MAIILRQRVVAEWYRLFDRPEWRLFLFPVWTSWPPFAAVRPIPRDRLQAGWY